MDYPKVLIGSNRFGTCLIAATDIEKDEIIAEFDGQIYEAEKCTDLPGDLSNHAIQFEEHRWRDGMISRNINHSCDPNCGMRGLFQLVAMQAIQKGEECTLDYEMMEDSDWRMECLCNKTSCRKTIGAFSLMPLEIRKKYKGYISQWLVQKYELS